MFLNTVGVIYIDFMLTSDCQLFLSDKEPCMRIHLLERAKFTF
jgi:hypothetical protein